MSDDNIWQAALLALITRCKEQTERYSRYEPNDPSACFEMWRRAIVERDNAAWDAVFEQYSRFVRNWLQQIIARTPALRFEEEILLNSVFINFFRAVTPTKFNSFNSVAAIMSYLKMCCATAVADAKRDFQGRMFNVSLDMAMDAAASSGETLSPVDMIADNFDLEQFAVVQAARADFWRRLKERVSDETNQRLIYMRYVDGMKPREIVQAFPDIFPTDKEVYRRLKNIVWLLSNTPDFEKWLES